jgi:hypothetical protein
VSIHDLIAEKKAEETKSTVDKKKDAEEVASKIDHITGRLKNVGLVTEVKASHKGADNFSAKQVDCLIEERTKLFKNDGLYAQAKPDPKKDKPVETISNKEVQAMAEERIAAFTNQHTHAPLKPDPKKDKEKAKVKAADDGNNLAAFEKNRSHSWWINHEQW